MRVADPADDSIGRHNNNERDPFGLKLAEDRLLGIEEVVDGFFMIREVFADCFFVLALTADRKDC